MRPENSHDFPIHFTNPASSAEMKKTTLSHEKTASPPPPEDRTSPMEKIEEFETVNITPEPDDFNAEDSHDPLEHSPLTREGKETRNKGLPQPEEVQAILIQTEKYPDENLNPVENKKSKFATFIVVTKNGAYYFGCGLAAIPTGFQTLLGALGIDLGKIKNFAELGKAFQQVPEDKIAWASVACGSSDSVNTVLNIVYLGPAFRKQLSIIKKIGSAVTSCFRKNNEKNTVDKGADWIDGVSLTLAILAALPFFQMAADSFSFFGPVFSYVPFSIINFLTYTANRSKGVEEVLRNVVDPNQTARDYFLRMMSWYSPKLDNDNKCSFNVPLEMKKGVDKKEVINQALEKFLRRFMKERNRGDSSNFEINNYKGYYALTTDYLGYVNALIAAGASMPIMTLDTIKGLESLLRQDIGKSVNYQNIGPWALGVIALATPFFYGRSVFNLPKELGRSAELFHQEYRAGNYLRLVGFAILELILEGASVVSGYSLSVVAKTMVDNGYLELFGVTAQNWLGYLLPKIIFATVASVNGNACAIWVNSIMESRSLETITEVDYYSARWLLAKGGADIKVKALMDTLESKTLPRKEKCYAFWCKNRPRIREVDEEASELTPIHTSLNS